jgi:uncharacterized Zn-finger protein
MELRLELPLDSDGFLRRQCPHCEREFKWKHEEADVPDRTDVFCPYCGTQSSTDQCWTNAQVEAMQAAAGQEMLLGLKGSGFDVTIKPPPPPLVEPDDMDPVASPCHPTEPVKVQESWTDPIHCLVCGSEFVV